MRGDLNGDGKITSSDGFLALRMALGFEPVVPEADIDTDGYVSEFDAYLISKAAVNELDISKPPTDLEILDTETGYYAIHVYGMYLMCEDGQVVETDLFHAITESSCDPKMVEVPSFILKVTDENNNPLEDVKITVEEVK